jgi:hydroxymethylpyrimidine/phosphomethylpyrimidine kinase
MLFSAEIIGAVAACLASHPTVPLVVDPVMVATSGARLLREDAVESLCQKLLPRATVITPNIPEAEILTGRQLDAEKDVLEAARQLAQRFACTVMIKGGHHAAEPGIDLVSDGTGAWRLSAAPLAAPSTHGTGCALSAGIAAGLAQGDKILDAIVRAKAFVYGSLQNCISVGPDLWAMSSPEQLPLDAVRCSQV